MKFANKVIKDSFHPLFFNYEQLSSGRRWRMPTVRTSRFRKFCSDLKQIVKSVTLLNVLYLTCIIICPTCTKISFFDDNKIIFISLYLRVKKALNFSNNPISNFRNSFWSTPHLGGRWKGSLPELCNYSFLGKEIW